MSVFEADFTCMIPNWGSVKFDDLDDIDQVEYEALNWVRDNLDGASDIVITEIRELEA